MTKVYWDGKECAIVDFIQARGHKNFMKIWVELKTGEVKQFIVRGCLNEE